MSDWDFLWEVDGAEREFAMETGLTYADLAYLEEQEEQERIRAERERISIEIKRGRNSKNLEIVVQFLQRSLRNANVKYLL